MKRPCFPEKLSRLHAEFKVYNPRLFRLPARHNILHHLKRFPNLFYFFEFFKSYQKTYLRSLKSKPVEEGFAVLSGVARSTDLPFVGQSVVRSGRARYMFVFEGSLSSDERLSVTVLACLWPTVPRRDEQIRQKVFEMFWPRPKAYQHIFDKLGISRNVAKHSYVVDAVRIGGATKKIQYQNNRELLVREMELVRPETVILVGITASRIVGPTLIQKEPDRFVKVPFPTKRKSASVIEKDNLQYARLRERLGNGKSRPGVIS